jgi:hypothetical protein
MVRSLLKLCGWFHAFFNSAAGFSFLAYPRLHRSLLLFVASSLLKRRSPFRPTSYVENCSTPNETKDGIMGNIILPVNSNLPYDYADVVISTKTTTPN